jgi:hypothetical protein
MAGTVIDEMLVVLGVDVTSAKAATATIDSLEKEIRGVGPSADKSFSEAKTAMESFTDGAKAAKAAVSKVFDGVGGILGKIKSEAFGAFEAVNKGVEELDKVAKKSRATGIGVEELQRLTFVAGQAGTDVNALAKASSKLNKDLFAISAGGGKKTVENLALLGLTAQQLAPLSVTDRLALLGDRLALVDNETQRVALTTRLLGPAGNKLASFLADGGAGIKEMADKAQVASAATVAAAEKQSDEYGVLQNQLKSFRTTALDAALPATKAITDAMNEWLATNRAFIRERIHEAVTVLGDVVKDLVPHIKDLADSAAAWVKENAALIRQELPGKLKEIGSAMKDMAGFFLSVVDAGRAVAAAIKSIDQALTPDFVLKIKALEKSQKGQEDIAKRAERRDERELGRATPRIVGGVPTGEEVEVGGVSLTEIRRRVLEDRRKDFAERQNKLLRDRLELLRAGKDKKGPKRKEPTSKISLEEFLIKVSSGEDPSADVKTLASQTPSSKDIKPTVAIDYFSFIVTQNITSTDPRAAGDESAARIKGAFQKATALNAPVGSVVR